MPDLLVFAACRRVIIDEQDHSASLIGLLDAIKVTVPRDQEIPGDAVIPFEWAVYSWWRVRPDDDGKLFEQRVVLVSPDNTEKLNMVQDIDATAEKYRVSLTISGFHVSVSGIYWVKLSIRQKDQDWAEVAQYAIKLVHELAVLESG
jgi:hypothetical protein